MNKQTGLLLITVLFCGYQTLWWWTNGLRTFTAEGARRLEVLENPVRLPKVRLEDSQRNIFTLDAYKGSWLLVEFIYTRCPTVCSALGRTFKRIDSGLANSRTERNVLLLSISFDPEYDTPTALQNYGRVYGADERFWRLARIDDDDALRRLLQAFGIIVIPNELGGYDHNAAIHLVNPEGLLVRIYDYEALEVIMSDLRSLS